MANVIFTPQVFANAVAMRLGDYLKIVRNLSTEYTKEFGKESQQVGNTISVKKPARFLGVDDSLTYAAEDMTQQKLNVTVDKTASVYFGWDSFEKTLSLSNIDENWGKPAARALAAKINARVAKYVALNTFNSVGTPGTVPNAMATFLSAKSKLIRQGMPAMEPLSYIINDSINSAYIDANKALFNSQDVIGKQMKTGRLENTLGAVWENDEMLYAHTTGPQGGTILVAGASQTSVDGNNGTIALACDGATNSTTVAKAGDVFTLGLTAGVRVESVHPESRVSTGDLQQFVLLSDATSNGSGLVTLNASPAITPSNGSNQYANVTAAPSDNSSVTFWGGSGDASKIAKQALLLHRDAFAFMSVPLANPKSTEMAVSATDPDTGVSVSFIRYFDGDNRKWKNRFDALFGMAPIYRELACRIQSGF